MIVPVYVYAAFNKMGKVKPIRFQLSLEKESPSYPVHVVQSRERGFGSYMETFYCTTNVKGETVEFQLVFDSSRTWNLIMSDSRRGKMK